MVYVPTTKIISRVWDTSGIYFNKIFICPVRTNNKLSLLCPVRTNNKLSL